MHMKVLPYTDCISTVDIKNRHPSKKKINAAAVPAADAVTERLSSATVPAPAPLVAALIALLLRDIAADCVIEGCLIPGLDVSMRSLS